MLDLGGLAVNGAVCLGLAGGVDDSHQAAAKLLQDHPLSHSLGLVAQLSLFCLLDQAVAGRLCHLLGDKRVGEPAGNKSFR